MIDKKTIQAAVELLRNAASLRKIVLFGSYATGKADEGSDIDILVVEEEIDDVMAETVRLLRVLSPLRLPVELVVVRRHDYDYWRDTPGNLIFETARYGKVLFEAA